MKQNENWRLVNEKFNAEIMKLNEKLKETEQSMDSPTKWSDKDEEIESNFVRNTLEHDPNVVQIECLGDQIEKSSFTQDLNVV